MTRRLGLAVLLALCAAPSRGAEEAPLPPGDGKPILQLEVGGPTAAVTALLFSNDGKTLYAAGLDKVVRVWEQEEVANKAVWTLKRSFRVPIGPGVSGAINALALSPDGRWLAVGGRSVMRGESDFRQPGVVVPIAALSEVMWRDGGTIYVFDQRNPAGGKVLRGHLGEVRALAFAPTHAGKPPLLVSAAFEHGRGKVFGAVRLWDVEQGGAALAVLENLPGPPPLPATPEGPGLAVWHTGDGNTDVRVAIAWPESKQDGDEGVVRLWDAAAKGAAARQSWTCGPWNSTAALLGFADNEPRVAFGSVSQFGNDKTGGLRVWRFSRAADTQAKIERQVPFVFDRLAHRPLALAAVSAQANGRFNYVAAVLQPGRPRLDNLLTLTDVAANPATVNVRLALKNTDPIHAPVVAAAPHGKWLAVAGFQDRAVEIYAVADLLANRTEPAARLRSEGVLYRKAVFVRRDKERGLWLSEDAKAKPLEDGTFFSFEKRALANDPKGWTLDKPARADWQVDFKDGAALVSHGATIYPKMVLDPGAEPTWYDLLPSTAQRKQALLAVAHTSRASAETYITLFDVATGRPLRRFTGHLQDVRWLAFSDTQPLLVSASEDQTVRVWSFADLASDAGMIEGLVVGERAGKVVVLAVEPNSAGAAAGLKADDVIEGFVGGDGKVKPVASAVDFYWAVKLKKPKDTVAVKVAGQAAAVRVAVGRGVEERKPLLSLFVTRNRREWIGWTPGGPFDRGSDAADALIAWQVNTGKPSQPVTFVTAKEGTGKFYKKDILKHLIATGSLERALEEYEKKEPLPEAEVSARVQGAERVGQRADLFQARQRNLTLTATLNADYPLEPRDQMSWQAVKPDGSKLAPQPMRRGGDDDRTWEADLSTLPWQQGEFRFEMLFHSEKYDRTRLQALRLRYQPPAPYLAAVAAMKELKAGAEPVTLAVMEPKLAVKVTVKPEPGQTVEVRFLQAGDAPKPRTVAKEETFTQEFMLQEGENSLEIVAVNKDALKYFETDETSALRLKVRYKIAKAPTVAVLRLTPMSGESFRDDKGRNILVVTAAPVVVTSSIEAEEPLALAEWSIDDKAKSLLEPQPSKKLDVRQMVDLKAGRTTVLRLRAATKSSKPAEEVIHVVYRPLLPRFTIAGVDGGAEVFRNEATVRGQFRAGTADEPYQATLRVTDEQGKAVGKEQALKPDAAEKWSAVVPLVRGVNTVEMTVRSEWRPAVTEQFTVTYKIPPTLDPVPDVKVGDKPLVSFEANAWSPARAKLLGATIDGRAWQGADFHETDETKNGLKRWVVTVREVPVKKGEEWQKTLVLNVRNADGLGRRPVTITVKPPEKPRPLVPPEVQLRIPNHLDTTDQPDYRVAFVVRSDSKLKRVELWRGQELLYNADLKKVTKDGATFELNDVAPITLNWDANPLKLLAVNGDGAKTDEATVSLSRPPVNVFVDRLDMLELNGESKKSLEPSARLWEKVRFDELTRGYVLLHGHVDWPDDKDERLNGVGLKVVVYVNGFRQFPVALKPRGSGRQHNQRAFEVILVLGKAKDNIVEIELPLLTQEGSSKRKFLVDCAQPVKKQRLHVLIIGVDVPDGEKLKRSFLSLWGQEPPRGLQGEFKSGAFDRAYLAGVLYDRVQKEDVLGQLGDIADSIRKLQKQSPGQNDVVLIYFQGSEATDARGNRYLKTSKNEAYSTLPLETTAIAYKELTPTPGVQVLLLNVARPTKPRDPTDNAFRLADPHVAVLRYVCRDAAELKKPVPTILLYLGGALQKASTLGEIVQRVTDEAHKEGDALATTQIPEPLKPLRLSEASK